MVGGSAAVGAYLSPRRTLARLGGPMEKSTTRQRRGSPSSPWAASSTRYCPCTLQQIMAEEVSPHSGPGTSMNGDWLQCRHCQPWLLSTSSRPILHSLSTAFG